MSDRRLDTRAEPCGSDAIELGERAPTTWLPTPGHGRVSSRGQRDRARGSDANAMNGPHRREHARNRRHAGFGAGGTARTARFAVAMWTVVAAAPTPAWAAPPGEQGRFDEALEAWDLDTARTILEGMADGPRKSLDAGALAHTQAEYAAAQQHLIQVSTWPPEEVPESVAQAAEFLLGMSRGGVRIFEHASVLDDDAGRFRLVAADPRDAVLAPYFFSAMAKADAAIGDALGVHPDPPIRFELLSDPADLSVLTSLSIDAVYTTNTIGICKYRRVMLVTPRALLVGYPWLDAAAHEYVHYLVTLRTRNRAPVWLQEGLAKLYETRWRSAEPEPLEPAIAKILREAIEADELVTLEQMYPSIALLPSQRLAALAYAEVQTMLQLVWERGGDGAIRDLMDDVAAGATARDALARAWGDDFSAFDRHWRAQMLKRLPKGGDAELSERRFRDPSDGAGGEDSALDADPFSQFAGGKARQHARLGTLLQRRGHADAAIIEYERARAVDRRAADHPTLARRLGELLLERGRGAEARPLLERAFAREPDSANLAASVGRARRLAGDAEGARQALEIALRINPFIPSLHCDLAALADDDETRARERAQCRER